MKNLFHSSVVMIFLFSNIFAQEKPISSDPFKQDVPVSVPKKISLAGSPEPDIVRFLKVESAGLPTVSPNGEKIAYTTRLTGEYQLWVTHTDTLTAPLQITYGNSVTGYTWSPSGEGILYATDKEGNERQGFYFITPDGLQEKELLPPADAFRYFGDFNLEGTAFSYATTERNGKDFDIHIYDLETDTDKKVYMGKLGYVPVSFSPNGDYVIISEVIGEDANNLYLLRLKDLNLNKINVGEASYYSMFGNIEWKADGSGFYLLTNSTREFIGVAYYDVDKNTMEYIIEESKDIEQVLLSADEERLHYVVNEEGYSRHHILNLRSNINEEAPHWPKGILSLRESKDGNTLTGHVESPKIPGDIWAAERGSLDVKRITRSNHAGLDLQEMVLPEPHSFKARDGLTVHGLLYSPREMTGNTPVIINTHGGPTSQARPRFNALHQYLLHKGFAILDLNYRGSTGYGKTYARENNLRKRANELYDLEDAVKYLEDQKLLNPKKVAIMGISYGGYLTMAALTRLPETFTCGVSFVGVSDWVNALEEASPNLKAADRYEYGDIDDPEERAFFKSLSPIEYIDAVQAPMMVIHGVNDPRNPIGESDNFVQGIREHGGEVTYLRFPDEGHLIRKMGNRITAYVRVAEFLEKHMID